MKPIPALAFAIVLLLGSTLVGAADAGPPPPRSPTELKELASVEQFLGLSDVELDQILQVITRIRSMKPAERAALRTEIEKFRQLPEGQRQHLRQGWGWMPPEVQDAWREMMQGATPERRSEIQQAVQALSDPDARLAYRRQLVDEYLKQKAAKK